MVSVTNPSEDVCQPASMDVGAFLEVTKVPAPGRVSTRPREVRSVKIFCTVTGLTPNSLTICRV